MQSVPLHQPHQLPKPLPALSLLVSSTVPKFCASPASAAVPAGSQHRAPRTQGSQLLRHRALQAAGSSSSSSSSH
jgi:hypothetical protein